MLGSTAVHLAASARCPLLVLPRLADDDDGLQRAASASSPA
jgi:hypothetical protein